MVIEVGLQYTNKTYTFLLPLMRAYGDEFIKKISSVFKLAAGVYDDNVGNTFENEKCIFILINNSYKPYLYQEFLSYIQTHFSYINHYTYNGNFSQTMFVLRIPEDFHNSYDAFIEGKYSKMFEDEDEVEIFLPKNTASLANHVCNKHTNLKAIFIANINKEFGTDIQDFEGDAIEYELPPKREEEIFNNKDFTNTYI